MPLYYTYSYESAWLNCSSYVAHKNVLSIVPMFLLSIGTFGNLVSFYVLLHKAFRCQSVYIYLAVLALADTAVLFIGLLPDWLDNITGYRAAQEVTWICKLRSFANFTLSQFSVWLIVAVTGERYLATTRTISALNVCTKAKARVVILGIFVFLCSLNCHALFTMDVNRGNSNQTDDVMFMCTEGPGYDFFFNTIWPWVDMCFYSLIPFAIIIVLNTTMIISVRRSIFQRNSFLRRGESCPRDGIDRKLMIMLISVSFVFIVTTIPINIVWIAKIFFIKMEPTTCQICTFKLYDTIARMLMYSNNSVNFFLYLLSGRKFRQHLADTFCPAGSRVDELMTFYKRRSFFSQLSMETKSLETKM